LTPADCELRDWQEAGLHQPSFSGLFRVTLPQRAVRLIGRLSESKMAAMGDVASVYCYGRRWERG